MHFRLRAVHTCRAAHRPCRGREKSACSLAPDAKPPLALAHNETKITLGHATLLWNFLSRGGIVGKFWIAHPLDAYCASEKYTAHRPTFYRIWWGPLYKITCAHQKGTSSLQGSGRAATVFGPGLRAVSIFLNTLRQILSLNFCFTKPLK
jgi:hypothetical protein